MLSYLQGLKKRLKTKVRSLTNQAELAQWIEQLPLEQSSISAPRYGFESHTLHQWLTG